MPCHPSDLGDVIRSAAHVVSHWRMPIGIGDEDVTPVRVVRAFGDVAGVVHDDRVVAIALSHTGKIFLAELHLVERLLGQRLVHDEVRGEIRRVLHGFDSGDHTVEVLVEKLAINRLAFGEGDRQRHHILELGEVLRIRNAPHLFQKFDVIASMHVPEDRLRAFVRGADEGEMMFRRQPLVVRHALRRGLVPNNKSVESMSSNLR
ncbi:MAG: hypothetical protein ACK56I_10160, partial [bacterium]